MYPSVMVMVLRMMCMEGLSHRDTLPPLHPPCGWGRGVAVVLCLLCIAVIQGFG